MDQSKQQHRSTSYTYSRFDFLRREVDSLESVEHRDAVSEHPVRQQEGVEEVDGEET